MFASHTAGTETIGGAEKSLLELLNSWRTYRPDDTIHVVLPDEHGAFHNHLRQNGFSPIVAHSTWWVGQDFPYATIQQSASELEPLLDTHNIDLAISNSMVMPALAIAAKAASVSHVWFVREYGDIDHGLSFPLGVDRTWQLFAELSSHVVTNSTTMAAYLEKWLNQANVSVLYPPVSIAQTLELANEQHESPYTNKTAAVRVASIGHIKEAKGQFALVEAVGIATSWGYDIEVALIGRLDEDNRPQVSRIIDTYDIRDRVHLLGPQENPFAYAKHANLSATLSRQEAFGRVTLEALALGLPVIATNSGANPELIDHGRNGVLINDHTPAAIAQVLADYAQHPEKLDAQSTNARTTATEITNRYPLNQEFIHDLITAADHETSPNPRPVPRITTIIRLHDAADPSLLAKLRDQLHALPHWLGFDPVVLNTIDGHDKLNDEIASTATTAGAAYHHDGSLSPSSIPRTEILTTGPQQGNDVLLVDQHVSLTATSAVTMHTLLISAPGLAAVSPRSNYGVLSQVPFPPSKLVGNADPETAFQQVRTRLPRYYSAPFLDLECILIRNQVLTTAAPTAEEPPANEATEINDLCQRLQAQGWQLGYDNAAFVSHIQTRDPRTLPTQTASEIMAEFSDLAPECEASIQRYLQSRDESQIETVR